MSLTVGSRLGHYEVTAFIGEGGMGQVYRATDTNLGRQVAIKVLNADLVSDANNLRRFEREARLLASLNHPNVATVHGFERIDELSFLVMECIQGRTLDELLDRGPLPQSLALSIFTQLADALDAAHGLGIVHRDLKPSNLKVTESGQLKLIDFGIAIAQDSRGSLDTASTAISAATNGARLTTEGRVIGTPAYMSPEQLCGLEVDHRTDVWSFGCLMFKALTRTAPFDGKTRTETVRAILVGGVRFQRG